MINYSNILQIDNTKCILYSVIYLYIYYSTDILNVDVFFLEFIILIQAITFCCIIFNYKDTMVKTGLNCIEISTIIRTTLE